MPDGICFDHDLSDFQVFAACAPHLMDNVPWPETEKTGMDCVKWLVDYCIDNQLEQVKPIVLIACKDTTHARKIKDKIDSDAFFGGRYIGKVIEISAMENTAAGFYRHPQFKQFRQDKNPNQCIINEDDQ